MQQPEYMNGNVRAHCPDCRAITIFEKKDSSRAFGYVLQDGPHNFDGFVYSRVCYVLMRCGGCGRAGLAKVHDNGHVDLGELESFHPNAIPSATLPANLPDGVLKEFREAELCAGAGAWRAASGMLRSTLEKLLRKNGYEKGSLASRIDKAAEDGVLTEARKRRAHEEVRVLGNDVLHDEWRPVTYTEFLLAHHYVQRITEDFYDDREGVEAILSSKGRLLVHASPESIGSD